VRGAEIRAGKRFYILVEMRAIRLYSQVEGDHTLSVRLPDDVAAGPAEVIVLVPEPTERAGHSLADFLARLSRSHHGSRSKQEIDRDLEVERESWES
jgi:hypothetical protein